MIRGRTARWGLCRFFSQLRTIWTSALRVAAISFWYRPRSSRRFRVGSPSVTKVLGYIGIKGFFVVRMTLQNGNATLTLRYARNSLFRILKDQDYLLFWYSFGI